MIGTQVSRLRNKECFGGKLAQLLFLHLFCFQISAIPKSSGPVPSRTRRERIKMLSRHEWNRKKKTWQLYNQLGKRFLERPASERSGEEKDFLFTALHLFGNHFSGFDLGLAWEKQIKLIGNQQRAGREVKKKEILIGKVFFFLFADDCLEDLRQKVDEEMKWAVGELRLRSEMMTKVDCLDSSSCFAEVIVFRGFLCVFCMFLRVGWKILQGKIPLDRKSPITKNPPTQKSPQHKIN